MDNEQSKKKKKIQKQFGHNARQTVFDWAGVIVIPGCKRRGRLVATLIHHEPSMAMRHISILGILSFLLLSIFIPSLPLFTFSLYILWGGSIIILGLMGVTGHTTSAVH